jgi:ribokinase
VLGDSVVLASLIGDDDSGSLLMANLKRKVINSTLVLKGLKETPQTVCLYDNEGKRQIHCDLKDAQEVTYPLENAEKALKKADIAVISNINFNRTLLKKARELGKIIVTDVHVLNDVYDEYNSAFLDAADILFLSDENLPIEPGDFLQVLNQLFKAKIIILGRGNKGAMMVVKDEHRLYLMESIPVRKVINTVGAGDALLSGFISYYASGLSPIESLTRAQIFAGWKIGESGASNGFIGKEEIEKMAATIKPIITIVNF